LAVQVVDGADDFGAVEPGVDVMIFKNIFAETKMPIFSPLFRLKKVFSIATPGPLLGEDSLALEVEVELAAVDVLRDEAQPVGRRERVPQRQQEGVVHTLKKKKCR
jgi:hypothetical protein